MEKFEVTSRSTVQTWQSTQLDKQLDLWPDSLANLSWTQGGSPNSACCLASLWRIDYHLLVLSSNLRQGHLQKGALVQLSVSRHPQQDSLLMKEVGVYGWQESSEGNFTWCWFSHIHLPKLEIKFSLHPTSLHTATTSNYLTEDTTEEEDLCDELILSEILGVVKVTMRDPLWASRDGTDTQFLNLMEKYGKWRSLAIVELVATAPTFQQHPQKSRIRIDNCQNDRVAGSQPHRRGFDKTTILRTGWQ